MTVLEVLICVLIAATLTAALSGYTMGRRGHSPTLWAALGALSGPAVIVFIVEALTAEDKAHPRTVSTGSHGDGSMNILVGIDGSDQALHSLDTAIATFASNIDRLTLAVVDDFDTVAVGDTAEAERILDIAAQRCPRSVPRPTRVILEGQPARSLSDYATQNGYQLIVVGDRGRGLSHVLLGRTAERLASGGTVPTFVVPDPDSPHVSTLTTHKKKAG